MTTLHLINKPISHPAAKHALTLARDGDALLFLGDGVNSLLAGSKDMAVLENLRVQLPLYGLEADLQARGLVQRLPESVNRADYPLFVCLTEQHHQTLSWF